MSKHYQHEVSVFVLTGLGLKACTRMHAVVAWSRRDNPASRHFTPVGCRLRPLCGTRPPRMGMAQWFGSRGAPAAPYPCCAGSRHPRPRWGDREGEGLPPLLALSPPPPSPPQDASHPLSAAPAFARCRGPPRGGPPRPWTPSSRRVRRRPSPPSQTAGGGCSRRVWAAHPPCRRRLPCCRPRRLWQRTDRRRALRCRHHHRRRRHRRCQRRRLGRRRRQAPSRSRLFRLQPTP